MRFVVLFLVLAVAVPAAAQSPPSAPSPPCHFSAEGDHYSVSRGKLTCAAARKPLRSFAVNERSPRGWKCRSGRPRERFDLQCRRRSDGRIVRATAAQS